jgi:hypothetical protein
MAFQFPIDTFRREGSLSLGSSVYSGSTISSDLLRSTECIRYQRFRLITRLRASQYGCFFFKFPFLIEIKPLLIIFMHRYDIFCFDAEDHNGCLPRNQPSSPCSGSAETIQIVANSILCAGHQFVPFWLRPSGKLTSHLTEWTAGETI